MAKIRTRLGNTTNRFSGNIMIAKEFEGANVRIAETQPEYQTLPAKMVEIQPGVVEITICFELTDEEKEQVRNTGEIWLKFIQGRNSNFHPIGMDCLKPQE